MIYQGHLYLLTKPLAEQRVIALQNHPTALGAVRCLRIEPTHVSGVGPVFWARAETLRPLPMKYFHGGAQ